MESSAYDALCAGEDSWWYRARTHVAERVMRDVHLPSQAILDVGAGFGGMLSWLQRFGTVDALELYPGAAEACERRGYRKVFRAWEQLETDTVQYGMVAAFDVLEHIHDDAGALRGLQRHLVPQGVLLLNVPAYPGLWSDHDRRHAHIRRYTKRGLEELLQREGFTIQYCGYWNTVLFPLFVLSRLVLRGGEEQLQPSRITAWIATCLLRWEAKLIPALELPFGSSLIVCAVRK